MNQLNNKWHMWLTMDSAVYKSVQRALNVYVLWALDDAVHESVEWPVRDAVYRSVDNAVSGAVYDVVRDLK